MQLHTITGELGLELSLLKTGIEFQQRAFPDGLSLWDDDIDACYCAISNNSSVTFHTSQLQANREEPTPVIFTITPTRDVVIISWTKFNEKTIKQGKVILSAQGRAQFIEALIDVIGARFSGDEV